ncbi:STAS domain-containing protein [Actinoplanes sp. NPDC023801]|uniref:STAS domain-containing protein n=1 Tax=Actinoplanes sp. NPDC023801 TaxID=3154595 RepID=UPI0034038DDB
MTMNVVPAVEEHDASACGTEILLHTMTGASVVRVVGDLDLSTATRMRTTLETALAVSAWVIVDLRGADAVDSVGLGVLIAARESARRHGGDLLLAAASPFFVSVLSAARLDALFTAFDTVPQAITYALNPPLSSPGPR